jgi:hypothetical protein
MKKIFSITSCLGKLIVGSSYPDRLATQNTSESNANKTITIAANTQDNRAGKFKRIIGILLWLQQKSKKRVTELRAVENEEIFDHLFIAKHPKQRA